MAEHSLIEWTDATWNPITGCTLVSEGCRHCYAAQLAATRLKNHPSRKGLARLNAAGEAKFTGEVRFNEQWLDQPLRWKRPRMIFVCAHSDLFHESVPDEWIDRMFAVMALAPQHTFQILTKRPERMRQYVPAAVSRVWDAAAKLDCEWHLAADAIGSFLLPADHRHPTWPLPNVWLGVSAERQQEADARIPQLLATPAAVRFLSAEPLLGPLDLTALRNSADLGEGQPWLNALGSHGSGYVYQDADTCSVPRLDWVIVGGESGRGARPMHPDWARSLRDECNAAGVPFFFKQWGEWAPHRPVAGGDLGGDVRAGRVAIVHPRRTDVEIFRESGRSTEPDSTYMARVGKKASGRLLDGREWNEMPEGL